MNSSGDISEGDVAVALASITRLRPRLALADAPIFTAEPEQIAEAEASEQQFAKREQARSLRERARKERLPMQ
ncbi:MAG: hypothetical protein ABSG95_11475 [Solirubrobacteraceae bacterium]|jgi:hypothetical protein